MPQVVPRASAIEQAAREVLREPTGAAERVLAGFVGIGQGKTFDVSILDALTPPFNTTPDIRFAPATE
ncbi:MAG TPA: hypothetical protein VFJ70_20960 [Burkholderiales bacterium]|nr:hypothetical protein [Burkholderiales bacterium]